MTCCSYHHGVAGTGPKDVFGQAESELPYLECLPFAEYFSPVGFKGESSTSGQMFSFFAGGEKANGHFVGATTAFWLPKTSPERPKRRTQTAQVPSTTALAGFPAALRSLDDISWVPHGHYCPFTVSFFGEGSKS